MSALGRGRRWWGGGDILGHLGDGLGKGSDRLGVIVVHERDCMTSKDLSQQEPAVLVTVSADPIDTAMLLDFVGAPECGAVVLFLGTVRNHSKGKTDVTHLEYEAYDGVVEAKLAEIVSEAMEQWPVPRVAVVHRVGSLAVGESSVAVAVASPHRADAFEAGRYLIDELKMRVPIWKKEHWPGGAEWVREDHEHAADGD